MRKDDELELEDFLGLLRTQLTVPNALYDQVRQITEEVTRSLPRWLRADTDLIVQNVVWTLFQQAKKGRLPSRIENPHGYIRTIAKCRMTDRIRSRRRWFDKVIDTPEGFVEEIPAAGADSRKVERLAEALLKLDEDSRKLIERVYFEGVSITTLAEELESTPGAMYTRLHRIRKQLLSSLSEPDEDVS